MRVGCGTQAGAPGCSGFTLVEILVSLSVIGIALLAALLATTAAARQTGWAKELELARLAARGVRENLAAVRFRGATAVDDSEWLFRGGYEIARNADGTSFVLPDLRSAPAAIVDDVGGAVAVEFPVPPLTPLAGRTHAGRLIFYVDETAQPAALPAAEFPFEPTPGLARLDCDGDGAFATTDLRQKHSQSANPCRLIPVRVSVEWRTVRGAASRHEEHFLLAFQGLE